MIDRIFRLWPRLSRQPYSICRDYPAVELISDRAHNEIGQLAVVLNIFKIGPEWMRRDELQRSMKSEMLSCCSVDQGTEWLA